ncbi:MAG: ScnB-like protein [Pseudomonadota bacterium]
MVLERKNSVRDGAGGRTVHDVGGLDFGRIDRTDHELSYYEQRVDAILMLMARHRAFTVDGLRRAVEDYSAQEYDGTAYYDRWIKAIRELLLEQEIIGAEELETRIRTIADRLEADGIDVDRSAV